MTIHGVDVSSHQPGWRPAGEDEFVFVKATEGRTYVNDEMTGQTARARAGGLVVGFYHFLLPGNATAQAAHFVQQANFKRGDLLVCDWENTASGHPSVGDAAAFIAETKRLVPECRVGLYCNKSDWLSTTVKAGDFLWLAAYMKSHGVTSPLLRFWQYSDHPIDQNTAYFTDRAELASWALATPEVVQQDVGPVVVPPVGLGDVTNPGAPVPDPTGDERSVSFRGGRTCVCVAFSLPLVEREMIRRGLIKRSIDVWQFGYRNDVKASAGYHARGGNTDVAQFSDEQLRCWRECGWAMQRRDVGFATKHGHGWPVGCPHLAKQDQVKSWLKGRNGLVGNGKIAGPGPVGTDTPHWREAAARLLAG
jgi:hypothetical protein